ncbi:Multidrug resistance-associated protein 1 [Cladochytrium tenue]|nr:Multidrug resistance-associated protein 1 [Cladochytrium tenue]
MSFYDATPLGSVLYNFARDLFLVDDLLPDAALTVLSYAPVVVSAVVMVCAMAPWFTISVPLYVFLSVLIIKRFTAADKALRAIEANNKAPMFAHLSASLEGLFSIRLYAAQDRFDGFNRSLIDADHKALFAQHAVKTVQALYLDLVACLAVYIAAVAVAGQSYPRAPSPEATGLALASALQLLLFLPFVARMAGDVHLAAGGAVNVVRFIDRAPAEVVNLKPPDVDQQQQQWPPRGAIEFNHVTLRYHKYGVAVLKSVSFRIAAGEKVAVVGRSGSGKTSLLVALLRIVEVADGDITVDGTDTRSLPLGSLRGRIAVIPQEPVLLSGTVRSNLDPYGLRSDQDVWAALRNVHLGDKVAAFPLGLLTPIADTGRTFALAERQLFCIARAILLRTAVVVFDQPAAAPDNDTDALLQRTIADNFAAATVLVLASRFAAVADTDRVLVMDQGRVVEFDRPETLLGDPRSKLSLMVSQTGSVDAARLLQAARARADRRAAAAATAGDPSHEKSGGALPPTSSFAAPAPSALSAPAPSSSTSYSPASSVAARRALPLAGAALAPAAAAAAAMRRRSQQTAAGPSPLARSAAAAAAATAVAAAAAAASGRKPDADGAADDDHDEDGENDDGDGSSVALAPRLAAAATPSPTASPPRRNPPPQMPRSLEEIFGPGLPPH